METRNLVTLKDALDHLESRALARDISPDVARTARAATGRMMTSLAGGVSARQQRRAEAYFWAVVSRRAVRRGQPARGAARVVVATVVNDLRASGRDGEAIWDHLLQSWSDSVPQDVLEEYRLELCG